MYGINSLNRKDPQRIETYPHNHKERVGEPFADALRLDKCNPCHIIS